MCSLIEHIERDIRARKAEQLKPADIETTTDNDLGPTPGPFLLPGSRLCIAGWNSQRRSIYNANYSCDGDKWLDLEKPWTVLSPIDFHTFRTYPEAATFAFKGMTK